MDAADSKSFDQKACTRNRCLVGFLHLLGSSELFSLAERPYRMAFHMLYDAYFEIQAAPRVQGNAIILTPAFRLLSSGIM
jgi:hypothetical protein